MALTLIFLIFLAIFGIRTSDTGEAGAAVALAPPTPGAVTCTVAPRSLEEIAALQATPSTVDPFLPVSDESRPVDDETRAQLEMTLQMADACAAEGDYGRLAALYSAGAIQAGALDEEGVPIEPGMPAATPQAEPPGKFAPPTVRAAWWIDETHILAEIERGPTLREIRFVQENGAWLIDSGENVTGESLPATPSAAAPLPLPVLQAIIDAVAAETGGDVQSITITSVEEVAWPDTSLGCPEEGGFYAQVITPGYKVTVEYQGQQIEVHTDRNGNAVRCDS